MQAAVGLDSPWCFAQGLTFCCFLLHQVHFWLCFCSTAYHTHGGGGYKFSWQSFVWTRVSINIQKELKVQRGDFKLYKIWWLKPSSQTLLLKMTLEAPIHFFLTSSNRILEFGELPCRNCSQGKSQTTTELQHFKGNKYFKSSCLLPSSFLPVGSFIGWTQTEARKPKESIKISIPHHQE